MSVEMGLEVIQHLDFKEAEACESEVKSDGPCGALAKWYAWYTCCLEDCLFCDECKALKRARHQELLDAGRTKCPNCGAKHTPETLQFRPLRSEA